MCLFRGFFGSCLLKNLKHTICILPSSSSSSGGEGIIEPCDPDWGRRREGLAVVFLLSLSDSLSRHTTSYNVSELFFLSFCFIYEKKKITFTMKSYTDLQVTSQRFYFFLEQNSRETFLLAFCSEWPSIPAQHCMHHTGLQMFLS